MSSTNPLYCDMESSPFRGVARTCIERDPIFHHSSVNPLGDDVERVGIYLPRPTQRCIRLLNTGANPWLVAVLDLPSTFIDPDLDSYCLHLECVTTYAGAIPTFPQGSTPPTTRPGSLLPNYCG